MTTISVSDTIDAVASNKYNKNNILVVCITSIALFGLSSYAESFLKTKENFWLTIIIPCIMYFFINGYYVITANNEINKKESVFPPISEISDILNKGFVYSIGILLISTVLYFIPFIIFTVGLLFTFKPLYQLLYSAVNIHYSANINQSLIFLSAGLILTLAGITVILVLSYYYFWPLTLQYINSFNFEDLFNVKKGIEFIKTKKELYKVFFWKSILLLFLYNIVFAFGIHLLFNLITHYNPRITQGFQSILLTIPNILYILTFPNLIGQLFNKTNK